VSRVLYIQYTVDIVAKKDKIKSAKTAGKQHMHKEETHYLNIERGSNLIYTLATLSIEIQSEFRSI
jgi:hypothetical protein